MELVIVVAAAQNGVIGINNTLPWRISADLQHFKQVTIGHPIIMGRKTYDSIGKPLPGRTTIVVTRQSDWQAEGYEDLVKVAYSLEGAMELAEQIAAQMGVTEAMLVGGAQLYRQALERVSKVHLTRVHAEIEGDAWFPELDGNIWAEVQCVRYKADEKNEYDYSFVELHRR